MLCDVCGVNQATVHLTEIVDEQMAELHLCEQCAKNKSMEMEQQFGLADLLAGLSDMSKTVVEGKEAVKLKCPNCGLTYDDFRKIGRFGCSECYAAFRKYLVSLLKRIHGSNKHYGKMPLVMIKEEPKVKSQTEELKAQLQKAIQIEDFEEAARIRDILKDLEKKEKS